MPDGKRSTRGKSARTPRKSGTRPATRDAADTPAPTAAAATGTPTAALDGGDAPSAFDLADEEVEVALQTGEHAGLLEDYFGAAQYAELRQLARNAEVASTRGGPRVLILPGIMGSKLGVRRKGRLFDDVYWIDPIDIRRGRLRELALDPPGSRSLTALGVVLLAYLRLKLRLRTAGYDAKFYPFDWRQGITELGAELKRELDKAGREVMLVAHSMGGLVARAALGQGAECRRLVMLGTPNFGSYAPVQALRGVYPVVRKVAALDRSNDARGLASQVFSTFPGLTQMLPAPDRFDLFDLYDRNSWPEPASGLCPRQHILDGVAAMRSGLAAADRADMVLIAGVDRETVVGVKLDPARGFSYEYSKEGDGTVPLTLALLPGALTYYIVESHGSLPNSRIVADAVIDVLGRGSTDRLPSSYEPAAARAATVERSESELLEREPYETRRDGVLSQRELRELIEEVAAPSAADDLAPATLGAQTTGRPDAAPDVGGYRHRFDRVIVGRRRQHRIDLRFAYGSITEADARALALGIFRNVTPGGAAAALDARVGGAITDLGRRRMFSGNVGEIFMLPTGRHPIAAEIIAFVGLGAFDRFTGDALQTASENVVRTFVNARVDEFATVVYGGATSVNPVDSLRNQLVGFLRGLRDADRDHHFRRIMICENDADRFLRLKEEMYRLSSTELCSDVELTFDEVVLPPPLQSTAPVQRRERAHDAIYLIVRQETTTGDGLEVRSSVLSAGAKATVVSGACTLDAAALMRCQTRLARASIGDLPSMGRELSDLVLAPAPRAVLEQYRDRHLVIVHDAPLSRVPWETLAFGDAAAAWFPAAVGGVSRRYAADNLSIAKWLEERVEDDVLSVLLVVDPTKDLQGAVEEGTRIRSLFQARAGCRLDVLWQGQATRPALLDAFNSGEYDVIHYAGHAFFDRANPDRSGLICANQARLTGADLAGLGKLPALAFFNACESARVRGARAARERERWERRDPAATTVKEANARNEHAIDAVGLAEAFMRGGIANFVGTYWPVGDRAAEAFAARFYDGLLNGDAIGDALQEARRVVREDVGSHDWANYLFYGNRDFALKDAPHRVQLPTPA
jgi:CHAT domain-containing protein